MVDTYKELAIDDYDTWKNKNKDKIKVTGVGGVESAYDVQENRAMYDAYVTEINAQNAYGRTKNALENNKTLSLDANSQGRASTMRENAILTERAKEYAEKRAKLNGTASAGVSQTAMIDLMSQMAGARADAQANYDNQERSIIQEYQDALLQAENARDNVVMTAQGNANAIASEAAVKRADKAEVVREGKVTDVENALADYDAGNITFDELKKTYEANQDVLDSEENKGIIAEYQEILNRQNEEASFFGEGNSEQGGNGATAVDSTDKGNAINSNDLKVTTQSQFIDKGQISLGSINALLDVDGAGSGDEQDAWVNEIVTKIKNGQIKDGTIIDMNYGSISGQNKGNYFVYKNGKLYQSDWTYDELDELIKAERNTEDWRSFIGKTASGDGEFKIKVNGKDVTFLRKDD